MVLKIANFKRFYYHYYYFSRHEYVFDETDQIKKKEFGTFSNDTHSADPRLLGRVGTNTRTAIIPIKYLVLYSESLSRSDILKFVNEVCQKAH